MSAGQEAGEPWNEGGAVEGGDAAFAVPRGWASKSWSERYCDMSSHSAWYVSSAAELKYWERAAPLSLVRFDSVVTEAKCDRGCGAMGDALGLPSAELSGCALKRELNSGPSVAFCALAICRLSCGEGDESDEAARGKGNMSSLGRRAWMLCCWGASADGLWLCWSVGRGMKGEIR